MTNHVPDDVLDADVLRAATNLIDRSGGKHLAIGRLHDDVPIEKAGWYAKARYPGAVITVENQPGPEEALTALCEKVLTGAQCQRCGGLVQLRDGGAMAYPDAPRPDGTRWSKEEIDAAGLCRWRREGPQWEPSCALAPEGDDEIHTAEKLALALEEIEDPRVKPIMWRARKGYYHDVLSPLAAPAFALVMELRELGHEDFAQRVVNGEFDATRAESQTWAHSPEGQSVFAALLGERGDRKKPRGHTTKGFGYVEMEPEPEPSGEQSTGAAFWAAQRRPNQPT